MVLMENVKERNLLEDTRVDRRIVLRWILNVIGACGLHSSGWGHSQVVGYCENGVELSGSKKCGDILD